MDGGDFTGVTGRAGFFVNDLMVGYYVLSVSDCHNKSMFFITIVCRLPKLH